MTEKDAVAIDFFQLFQEEKRRARRLKKADAILLQNKERTKHLPHETKDRQPSFPAWNCTFDSETFPMLDPLQHRISKQIDTVCYIPRFLSDQSDLLKWLQNLPENSTVSALPVTSAEGRWTTMTYGKRRVALFIDNLPPPLQQLADLLVEKGIFSPSETPNHVLVNEYHPGQGILPHTDGPAYIAQTATLSIGHSNVLLKFVPRLRTQDIGRTKVETVEEVLLEGDGSLLVFSSDAYSQFTHGIDDLVAEVASSQCVNAKCGTLVHRGHRISLTFRHALARVPTGNQ